MPLVNRTFDQLIDFTRTSAATFVNSSGNIASTPQSVNLLTFTQEFDNAAWLKTAATITANSTAAPDATNTADTYTESSATSFRVVQAANLSFTSGVSYTISVYAKQGSGTRVLQLYPSFATGGNSGAAFNLLNGTVVSTAGTGSGVGSITSVGNGWYRCAFTFVAQATGTNSIFIGMAPTTASALNASYAGDGTSSLFIWGAQLEQASAATDYTRNFGGLFPPRFDYDPVTRAPRGLLIEEQRTNLLVRSQEFDSAWWSLDNSGATNPVVTANQGVAPDGTTTADRIVFDKTGGTFSRIQQGTAGASSLYTFSVWMRTFSGSGTANVGIRVDTTGVNCAVTGTWQRFSVTTSSATTNATGQILLFDSIVGNDETADVLVWGAQLEAGAFATSYIPTVASQVTRTADSALIQAPNFASWYNQSSGTFVAEFQTVALRAGGTTGHRVAVANDGSNSNVVYLYTYAAIAGGQVVTGGVNQADINGGGSPANNTTIKSAIAYATNDVAVTVNGATPTTDTSVTIPTVNQLGLGSQQSASQLNGWLRSVRYYPTRLTNAQLQALTA